MGLLDHMVALFLIFKETSILFSVVAMPIYIPTENVREFPFLHILSAFIVRKDFFDDGRSDRCEVLPPCSFDMHFSNSQ